ncbi:MAG: MTH1187 family thiamine-binding protein [candidate division Zixibacteria bacterium]|nr:MTH1187 family thiamine-binding protein [candidate division Zixibacteria bacterium]
MLFNLSMFPTGTGTASVSAEVSKVINIIDKSGLPYKLGSMSTVIEGDWNPVMNVINKARLALRRKNSRVYIVLTIDDRKGVRNRLTGKVRSIESKLRREVKK